MNNKLIIDKKIVYTDNYLNILDKISHEIIEELFVMGYKRCFSDNFDTDLLLAVYNRCFYQNDLVLRTLSAFDNEIAARSEALNLFDNLHSFATDFSGIALINGYLNDESHLVAGIFKDEKFIKVVDVKIYQDNNRYIVTGELSHQISQIVEDFCNEHKIIDPFLKTHYAAGVVLEKNDPVTRKTVNKSTIMYNLEFADNIEGAKQQYDYLENEVYLFILEFGKKGRVRIKCPCLELYEEVKYDDIGDFMNSHKMKIHRKILSISNSVIFEYASNNTKCLCEECLNKMNNVIISFNQRLKEKCDYCGSVPSKNVIKID